MIAVPQLAIHRHMHERRPSCILFDAPGDCGPAAFIGLLYQSHSAAGLIVSICRAAPAIRSSPALPFTKRALRKFDLSVDRSAFNFEYSYEDWVYITVAFL